MPTYKLTYFNARGRAEFTRMALAAAGIEFEDVRLTGEEWQKLKPSTPQKQLPMLEVDGKIIVQSNAMVRYVAREHGLYGDSNFENTMVDVVMETIEDWHKHAIKFFFEKDPEKKQEILKEVTEKHIPHFLEIFEKTLGGKNWMVGSKMTIADLAVYNTLEFMELCAKNVLDGRKTLDTYFKRVGSIPNLKAWLDKRPKTDY